MKNKSIFSDKIKYEPERLPEILKEVRFYLENAHHINRRDYAVQVLLYLEAKTSVVVARDAKIREKVNEIINDIPNNPNFFTGDERVCSPKSFTKEKRLLICKNIFESLRKDCGEALLLLEKEGV